MYHPDDPFDRRELELELELEPWKPDLSSSRNDFQRNLWRCKVYVRWKLTESVLTIRLW